jgi:predicted HicB family RNase H-like nuclease
LKNYIVLQDQLAFTGAFDSYVTEGGVEPLQHFVNAYPDSDWAERATVVIAADQQVAQLQLRNEEDFEQLQVRCDERVTALLAENAAQLQLRNDEDSEQLQVRCDERLTALLAENAAQKEAVAALTEQIEQLKNLLIALENRSR